MSGRTDTWPGRIPGDPVHDRIIAYLTVDIQKSPVWIAELKQKIHDVQTGKLTSWERAGNAYCLHVYPNHVEIEDDYAEEPGEVIKIPIAIFAEAVNAWQEMIENNRAGN